jgi:hypothetical protein
VNLELCTLHLKETHDLEQILSFLLFADGCAASIVSSDPQGIELQSAYATVIPQSGGQITWQIGGEGYDMVLSGQVPTTIMAKLPSNLDAILDGGKQEDIQHWAIHPGGRTILDAVQVPSETKNNNQPISAGKRARMSPAVHCGTCPAATGSRMRLIAAQKGRLNAPHVIARSMAEPVSRSKKAKTWPIPSRAPRHNPKPTFPTAEQRKTLDAEPQNRPRRARRTIGFTTERSVRWFWLPLLVILLTALALGRSENLYHSSD